jgi:sec-independent protein translocase protein TatA
MPQLGPLEIVVILVVALLVFGPNRLPEIGRQVGSAFRELRRVQHDVRGEMKGLFADDATEHAAPAPTLPPKTSPPAAHPAADRRALPAGPGVPAPSRFAPPDPPASAVRPTD